MIFIYLFIFSGDKHVLRLLHALFLCFEVVFGLKINLAKPKVVLVGNVQNVDELASILGCSVSYLPLKYLGLPLRAHYKAKYIWVGVIEKIEHQLVNWKKMYSSKGEKVNLIKRKLFNLPKVLSLFPLPMVLLIV